MAHTLTYKYQINGRPMYAPDNEQGHGYEDIDAPNSGRTLDGMMHRNGVRYKVGHWSFNYSTMTEAEKQYTENLFPNADTFQFTHPDRINADVPVVTTCYRSKYELDWFNATTGLWKNYTFNIIEC